MRQWRSDATDDGSIHCLGNGRLCAYGQGLDLIQVFGPPYSSPACYQLLADLPPGFEARSEREPGAALWTHRLYEGGREVGELVDFVDAELPCLVRRFRSSAPLRFRLGADPRLTIIENGGRYANAAGGWLLAAPSGLPIYHTYPFPRPIHQQIAWRGAVEAGPAGPEERQLVCGPGEGTLYLCGGAAYPETIANTEVALALPVETLRARTLAWWRAFAAPHRALSDSLPANLPLRAELAAAIDSVAVLIRAQQSAEGALLAGHNYHLGYVRDQYGVARGLLALGHCEEARHILEFYWGVWQRYGRIHNAQAVGVDGVFHAHENDAVEITGYLIRQAFDLLARTGDEAFIETIFPMLEWAWEAQKAQLVEGMLPFNGDETYVAGGILPRHTLNDGSAEATLLFLDSGQKLLDWATAGHYGPAARLTRDRALLAAVRARYRDNFWRAGRLITNNPRRAARAPLPRFRHGVCERRASAACGGVLWTERDSTGRYQCPACLSRGPLGLVEPVEYALQSVGLTPFYFHSDLFAREELAPGVAESARRYRETGRLPSRPDDEAGRTVGYDYGLLLYALAEIEHPAAAELYRQTLSLLDGTGAWVEYYSDGRPEGTRCRPWESAINIEAALRWAAGRPGQAVQS